MKICYFTTLILLTSSEINIHITAWRNQTLHLMERQGRERGAVVASHGSAGYYTEQRCLRGCVGCWVIRRQKGTTLVSPIFLSSHCLGLWCDAAGAEVDAVRCGQRGFGESLAPGGMRDLKQSPSVCRGPEHEAAALTPWLHPNPLVGVRGAGGGDAVPPVATVGHLGCGCHPWVPLCHLRQGR